MHPGRGHRLGRVHLRAPLALWGERIAALAFPLVA
jgi:hypothetical protein